jgi:hypothetical protein
LIEIHPGIDAIGIARLEQAGASHGMGAEAIGNFEQGGGPLAHIGARVVVAGVEQFRALHRG